MYYVVDEKEFMFLKFLRRRLYETSDKPLETDEGRSLAQALEARMDKFEGPLEEDGLPRMTDSVGEFVAELKEIEASVDKGRTRLEKLIETGQRLLDAIEDRSAYLKEAIDAFENGMEDLKRCSKTENVPTKRWCRLGKKSKNGSRAR